MQCDACGKQNAGLSCGVCARRVCKSCARFVGDGLFAFLEKRPPELSHDVYCEPCYHDKVAPAQADYEETLARARDVNVFFKTQGKESRFIRRSEKPIHARDCADREETVLKLAFVAAQAGFNAIIDVDLHAEKIRNGGWQTSRWSGSAIPARVDPEQLKRRFASSPN